MAIFLNGNARIYYEDVGKGEPIIASHGLSEDTTYWSEPGVTAALAEKYRVISMDMRGHGRTVTDEDPKGYDEVTMGDDFTALADHLNIEKFHLLSHATGGMVAATMVFGTQTGFSALCLPIRGRKHCRRCIIQTAGRLLKRRWNKFEKRGRNDSRK